MFHAWVFPYLRLIKFVKLVNNIKKTLNANQNFGRD